MKETCIVSAFPACGKTYAFEKLNKEGYTVLDSDSSKFSWCYDGGKKRRNPDFPQNYIRHIKENLGKVDYIFVSSHKEVRDALIENKFDFTLVYPYKSMKEEWIGRCFLRGSDKKFCQLIADNWDKWIDEMESIDYRRCDKILLGLYYYPSGVCKKFRYLSELIKYKMIQRKEILNENYNII